MDVLSHGAELRTWLNLWLRKCCLGRGNVDLSLSGLKCDLRVSYWMSFVDQTSIRPEERIAPIVKEFRDGAAVQYVCCWSMDLPLCVGTSPLKR